MNLRERKKEKKQWTDETHTKKKVKKEEGEKIKKKKTERVGKKRSGHESTVSRTSATWRPERRPTWRPVFAIHALV